MRNSGKHNEYYWVEIVSDNYNMDSLILEFPEFVIDKYLAIVSFDSDSFLPTKSELQRDCLFR